MSKEKRLGRGLEALLGRPAEPAIDRFDESSGSALASHTEDSLDDLMTNVGVHLIEGNPFQPRRDFTDADIQELADSIEAHGMLQPLVVRKFGQRYQLVAGERRLRAAIRAGWKEVPAQVCDVDDRKMAELAIVENLQRRDLNSLEKAASFQQYLHQYACTQEELASRLKIDRSTVANLIRLLELPQAVQQALREGLITQGHARALLPLGDEAEQIKHCQRIQAEGLSVRATEQMVSDAIHHADTTPHVAGISSKSTSAMRRTPQIAALEQEFRNSLGTKVDIREGARERGKIVIHFRDHAEFERLRSLIASPALARMAG